MAYGREPRLPGDILRPYITREMLLDKRTVADITSRELELLGQHRAAAEFRLKAMGEADKKRWDAKIKPTSFEIGDMVILTHEGKFGLEPRFKGPYIITKIFPDYGTYQLETIAGEPLQSLVHVDRIKAANGEKPLVPWYDPTTSRRAVREADRLRMDTNNVAKTLPKPPSNNQFSSVSISPKQNLNQPQDDFIDMPVPTTTASQNTSQMVKNSTPNSISEEDSSVHGSSIMDETENNDRAFEHVLDGYDFMSSADSDIEIPDQPVEPSSSSSTVSSNSPSSYLSSPHADHETLNEQISVDSGSDIDERVTEPEINEQMLNAELEESNTSENINPQNINSPSENDHLNTETVNPPPENTNLSPNSTTSETNIATTTSNQVPSSNFSFTPPPNQTKTSQANSTKIEKFIDLSFKLPSSNSTPESSTTAMTKSNDVQGRTSVSKGGDVSISVDTSNDPDLQDIIEMLNSNRNKKRKFKPKIPATRNIKQRLNMITQSILNILTVQP